MPHTCYFRKLTLLVIVKSQESDDLVYNIVYIRDVELYSCCGYLAYLPSHLVLLHLYLGCRVCLVSVCSECIPSSSWYERCKIALVARMRMDTLQEECAAFIKLWLDSKMVDLWSTQIFKMWIIICQCCKISSKFGWYKPVFSYTELKRGWMILNVFLP